MNMEWSLTVAEAIKRPLFQHASLVAGSRGLSRPVRWVHVLESAETCSFLNGGELVLTTGLGFGGNPDKRLTYLNELINRQAVGLCIELGAYMPDIPDDMRELAEKHDFPLIAFLQPVRFVDITLDLHELIVNRQNQALRRLEAYSRDLQQLALRANGLARLLDHFQRMVQTQTFVWSIDGPHLFAPAVNQAVQHQWSELMDAACRNGELSDQTSGVLPVSGNRRILYQPVVAMGHVLAYLGAILEERDADEFLLVMLDYTATAMAQILLRRMFAEERALDSRNRLLDDLLQERIQHEEQIRAMLNLPKDQAVPRYMAVIVELEHAGPRYAASEEVPFHDLLGVFRSILTRNGFRSLMLARGNRLYLLLMESGLRGDFKVSARKAMLEMERSLVRALHPDITIRFGAGRISERYAEAKRHFLEAEQALTIQTNPPGSFFDDLGVLRLLLQVNDGYMLTSFITDYLGPLIRHDETHHTQLVLTLKTLLDHNGSKQETADRLFISRQTLYHRLEKIRELIGDTYLSPHHRLCLELALRAYEWLYRGDKKRPENASK